MVERNLIKEGFVINTLDSLGAISGTQVVSIPEINALVDEDISTTALTVSGGELIALDADLGARWKLTRLEYHTTETDVNNFSMEISDDNDDFFPVTFTGSTPLYVGDISPTTVSGAPRYIRLEHSPVVNQEAREWRAVSDDTLVDFGPTGNQTSLTIKDAPIGKPSSQVESLELFNRFEKAATGFIFIDPTGTDADDNIEVSISPTGPWFGRNTNKSIQPDNTFWESGDSTNVRVVSGTGHFRDFKDGDTHGWNDESTMTGFGASGGALVGTTAALIPIMRVGPSFGNTFDEDFITVRTDDYDKAKATFKIPTLNTDDIVEGPRFFWADHGQAFNIARSVLSTVPSGNFTGALQEFTFDLGSAVTWSGVATGFQFRVFTATSGLGIPVELHDLEIFHSGEKERLALDYLQVPSGTFPEFTEDQVTDAATGPLVIINHRNKITQPCIITRIKLWARPPVTSDITGIFLARFKDGGSFPSPGDNFEVKRVVRIQESQNVAGFFGALAAIIEIPVFWPAQPGDFLGYSDEGHFLSASVTTTSILYKPGVATNASFRDTGTSVDLSSTAAAKSDLDSIDFSSAGTSRNYLITYDAASAGQYVAAGSYRTPIFDGGSQPALLSASFESEELNSTSVDVSGNAAFDTINARASDFLPRTSLDFGEFTGVFYRLNDDTPASELSTYSINQANATVTAREITSGDDKILNVAGSILYHEQKDELWALNLLVSGTVPNDISPTWDVFDVETGDYKRTQALGGGIFYAYQHPGSDDYAFEPMGFVADYDREEIFIVQRENAFFIGSNSYYGIKMDLDGNFLDVMFKSGDMSLTTTEENNRFNNCIDVAYDGTYFYFLTNDTPETPEDLGKDIVILKLDDGINEDNVDFKQRITVSSIAGLSFASSDETAPRALAYNSNDDLFYLAFHNTTGSEGADNREPELYTISLTPDDNDVFTSAFVKSVEAFDLAQQAVGFNRLSATANNLDAWAGVRVRKLAYFTDMIYIPKRDSFGLLQTHRSDRSPSYDGDDTPTADFFAFYLNSHSFFVEAAAGGVIKREIPGLPATSDLIWGTASGTLNYEQVQKDSVLFPTGRFAQIEYVLNSNSGNVNTPYISKSKLTQGVRVDGIPANGTRTIYLRTNIPEGTSVAGQQGRLKVFWQLEEC